MTQIQAELLRKLNIKMLVMAIEISPILAAMTNTEEIKELLKSSLNKLLDELEEEMIEEVRSYVR